MIEVNLDNVLTIKGLDEYGRLKGELKAKLTMLNPKFTENEKQGRWNGKTSKYLKFYRNQDDKVIIPRGLFNFLTEILKKRRENYILTDKTNYFSNAQKMKFKGTLHDYQATSVHKVIPYRFSVLQSPTGSGKTVIALKIIAERNQTTLVIVHSKELLYQWRDRAQQFLGLNRDEIGLVGDGNKKHMPFTIAIVNSLYKANSDVLKAYGHVVVDECHRTPSRTFTSVMKIVSSHYMLGLSATPYRRDGLGDLINYFIGDTVHVIKPEELQEKGKIMKASLQTRHTDFNYDYSDDYSKMITSLVEDTDRNALILKDIRHQTTSSKGVVLVISDRKSHCQLFHDSLVKARIKSELLTGDTKNEDRKNIVKKLESGKVKVLVSTSQLIGEGFDCKGLNSLFLTTPMRYKGKLTQAVGRILRVADGKNEAKVFDYVDKPGVLKNAWYARNREYKAMGII